MNVLFNGCMFSVAFRPFSALANEQFLRVLIFFDDHSEASRQIAVANDCAAYAVTLGIHVE